jgi:hypothetical protein
MEVIVVTGDARGAGVAVAVLASGASGCGSEPAGERVRPVEGLPESFPG